MEIIELQDGQIITIRKAAKEDASIIIPYLNEVAGETDFLSFGKDEFMMSIGDEAEYIEKNNGVMFLVFMDDKLASVSQLIGHTKKRELHTCELAISIRKEFWGLGIGKICLGKLIQYAKHDELLKLIYLEVVSENKRALSLYKNIGFIEAGEIPALMRVDDRYLDVKMMYLPV